MQLCSQNFHLRVRFVTRLNTFVHASPRMACISHVILANMLILEFNGNSWYLTEKKDKFAGSNTELKFKLRYSVEQILLYNVPK